MEHRFPVFKLPKTEILRVLHQLRHDEKFAVSLLSNRALHLVKSLNIKLNTCTWNIGNQVGFETSFTDDTYIDWIFFDASRESTRESRESSPERSPSIERVFFPRSTPLPTPNRVKIKQRRSETPATVWFDIRMDFKQWLRHFLLVFNHEKLNFLKIATSIFEARSIENVVDGVEVVCIQFEGDDYALPYRIPILAFNFDYYGIRNLAIQKFLLQNSSMTTFLYQKIDIFDELLMCNSKDISCSMISEKSFNRFLKTWKKGSNPRLRYFSVEVTEQYGNQLMNGIQQQEVPEAELIHVRAGTRRAWKVDKDNMKASAIVTLSEHETFRMASIYVTSMSREICHAMTTWETVDYGVYVLIQKPVGIKFYFRNPPNSAQTSIQDLQIMEVQSLLDLMSKNVAEQLFKGTLDPSNLQLGNVPSEKIFKELCHLTYTNYEPSLYRKLLKTFNMTNVDHRQFYLCQNSIALFKKQKLESLCLGRLEMVKKYTHSNNPNRAGQRTEDVDHVKMDLTKTYDIVAILKDILNPESRRKLAHLSINAEISEETIIFKNNWIKPISKMLPLLQTLCIRDRTLYPSDFTALCTGFPNLSKLNINGTNVTNLNGISRLENLEVLFIGNLNLPNSVYMLDLFNLRHLKVLSLSCEQSCHLPCCPKRLVAQFLECNRVLPELIYLDCSFNDIEDYMFDRLRERCPKLETISAIGTNIERVAIEGIQLFTAHDLASTNRSLAHYTDLQNRSMLFELFGIIDNLFTTGDFVPNLEDLRDCANGLCKVFKNYPSDFPIAHQITPVLTSVMRYQNLLGDREKLNILDCFYSICLFYIQNSYFIDFFPKFEGMFSVLLRLQDQENLLLNIDKFYKPAIQVLMLTRNQDNWKLNCLDFIFMLRSDKWSIEELNGIDMALLKEILRKFNRSRTLDTHYKKMAGELERHFSRGV